MSPAGPAPAPTPAEVAADFLDAVTWGRHLHVWELLSPAGRAAVVDLAAGRGLDPAVAGSLRAGQASPDERDDFLTALVHGLRRDLQGVDLDRLVVSADVAPILPDLVSVALGVDAGAPTPAVPGAEEMRTWPVGSVHLARCDGAWLVERLVPRPGPTG